MSLNVTAPSADDRPVASTGEVIGKRYRLGESIGEGGMSVVFDALDLRTGTHRALKILRSSTAVDPSFVLRFQREAQLLDAIEHPAIVKVLDSGLTDSGALFLVMEKLEGETLHERFRRESPLPVDRLLPIVSHLASALDAVHQRGFVHRDLKPSNVFVTRDPAVPIKLIDFGLAKVVADPKLTKTGEIMGTPHFMAPEQLLSSKSVDARADVFGMAVIAYGGLTGRVPFAGETMDALRATLEGRFVPLLNVRPSLDPAIAKVVESGLAPNPDDRCPSARAFGVQFKAAAEGRGFIPSKNIGPTIRIDASAPPAIPVAPVGAVPSIPPRRRRSAAIPLVLTSVVILGAGGAAAAFAVHGRDPERQAQAEARPIAIEEAPPARAPVGGAPSTVMIDPLPAVVTKVRISSEPEGATAESEGTVIGTTPLELDRPADGTRAVTLTRAGYEPTSVLLMPTSPDELRVALERTHAARSRDRSRSREVEPVVVTPVMEEERGRSEIVCPWCGARGHCVHLDGR
jgi:hypothetical protein